MSSATPRRKRTSATPLGTRCSDRKNSRAASTRSASSTAADASSTAADASSTPADASSTPADASSASQPVDPAPLTETIDVLDSSVAGEEDVVDLTCEGNELAAVVDLTNNDSVVLLDEGSQSRRETSSESYVVSSDEEEDATALLNAALLSSLQASSRARSTPGTISCPVCMDAYAEIVDSGRLVVSTKCGHVFCSQCLRDALARSHTCPTCRKKLTHRQYHPIYI